jgi:hypothetical protein
MAGSILLIVAKEAETNVSFPAATAGVISIKQRKTAARKINNFFISLTLSYKVIYGLSLIS